MLFEEACWIGERVTTRCPCDGPVLNIGSSTAALYTRTQPWIDQRVLAPVTARGHQVLNVDLKRAPGVDLVGDICDASFRAEVATCGARTLLCTNLLEHVRSPTDLARGLVDLLPHGGHLVVSVPHSYPFHPDPIDNGFRPNVEQLAALFPDTELVDAAIVECGTYWDRLGRSPWRLAGALLRQLVPFYLPRWWWADLVKLRWLFRPFSATCVVLRRSQPRD